MTAGVYVIENTANGRVYVGSSRNITRRWSAWKSLLNGHPGKNYQEFHRDWAALGAAAFTLRVLEPLPPDRTILAEAETRWIGHFGIRCYNVLTIARKSRPGPQQEGSLYTEIGERIRMARLRQRLSQSALGARLGVTHAAISDIECGKTKPDLDILGLIADTLSVPLSDLVTLDGRP